jgi:tetratricopeptide (TPR) repeat protein
VKSEKIVRPSSAGDSVLASLFLIGITWAVFGQTLGHDFVNFDDRTYVYGNPDVISGITWNGIQWAFTHPHARNWHPLTTLSHMFDCQLFGLRAGGHHFTNVLLHTISVLLLFFLLRDMTSSPGRKGSIWRSLFVASVFAVHPLRVESVTWIAERKDVLSALFFMLTLGAYIRYARRPSAARYVTTSISFALGLMCKPMLVTVPFVLLLLDYWPLDRIQKSGAGVLKLIAEKIPLLLLSFASCAATIWAQSGETGALEQLPLAWRISNALVSYVVYIRQFFWPADLAGFYPYRANGLWHVALAAILLLGITVFAFIYRRPRPFFLVGWFWFLGMLVPVIGIFQIGLQGHADRYTYLSQIGLCLGLTWTVAEMSIFRAHRRLLVAVSAIVVFALAACAWHQTSHWKNSETLWKHTLAVTSDNDVAHNNLGLFYERQRNLDEAISQYETALQIQSSKSEARYNLSKAVTHTNIGNALASKGDLDAAVRHYTKAVELRPDYADAHFDLANAFLREGRPDESIAEFEKTLAIQPDDAEAHSSLGNALLQKGLLRLAMDHYEKAIAGSPPSVFALNNLAWILSTHPDAANRNGTRAMDLARRADQYSQGRNPSFTRTLGAAYAEAGRFEDAMRASQRAGKLAVAQGDSALANEIKNDIDLYRAKSPLRDSSLLNPLR